MDKTADDIFNEIFDTSMNVIDTSYAKLYINSNEAGTVPIDTGETQETTTKTIKVEGQVIKADIEINTDYAIYPYYGNNVSGINEWLEETAKKIGTKESIETGLKEL